MDSGVRQAFDAALETLRGGGATLVDIDLPHATYAIPVYYLVATAEASSNLARYDGVRYGYRSSRDKEQGLRAMHSRSRDEGFGAEVKRRIMLGTYVLSAGYYDAFYLKAQQGMTLLRNDYQRAFEKVDVVAMPTSPIPRSRSAKDRRSAADVSGRRIHGQREPGGLPAISIPCGFVERSERSERLPVGLQLTGRLFDESTLLRVADAYERMTDWHTQTPPIEYALERVELRWYPFRRFALASPTRSRSGRPEVCALGLRRAHTFVVYVPVDHSP